MYRLEELLLFAMTLLSAWRPRGQAMAEMGELVARRTHCTYEYAYDMYGAHCASLELSEIPSLKGGIEILDFSDNKLQEVHADTLSRYSSIRFLYLVDNRIYSIDDDAFTSLTVLETLDLSSNAIMELPNSMFQLPSLRNLYLKGNPILLKTNMELILRPIRAPLKVLDVSNCKIKELPNWGILPQLNVYNISHNPLLSLNTAHFAPMCSLEKVDLTESIKKISTLCSIRSTILWFQAKRVFFQLEDYNKLNTKEFESCPVQDNAVHNSTYHLCKAEFLQVQSIKRSRRTWLTIGGGLAGFLIGFILLLYVMHRHNVAQTKTTAEKIKKATPAHDPDKLTTAALLREHEVSRL